MQKGREDRERERGERVEGKKKNKRDGHGQDMREVGGQERPRLNNHLLVDTSN